MHIAHMLESHYCANITGSFRKIIVMIDLNSGNGESRYTVTLIKSKYKSSRTLVITMPYCQLIIDDLNTLIRLCIYYSF